MREYQSNPYLSSQQQWAKDARNKQLETDMNQSLRKYAGNPDADLLAQRDVGQKWNPYTAAGGVIPGTIFDPNSMSAMLKMREDTRESIRRDKDDRAWEMDKRKRTRDNWARSDEMRGRFESLMDAKNALIKPDKFEIRGV